MKYRVPIYRSTLYVVIAPNVKEALKHLPPKFRKIIDANEDDDDNVAGYTIDGNGEVAVVLFTGDGPITHNTVFHEAGHACLSLCAWHEIKVQEDNAEPYCYLLGWLGSKIADAAAPYMAAPNKKGKHERH